MFLAGDEFCNTQFGNNNAYCQDNRISWLDWTRLEKYQDIYQFFKEMIAFRKNHAILRKTTKNAECNLQEISVHNGAPWNTHTRRDSRLIGIMYAGRDEADTRDDIVFYAMNAYWEPLEMQLPELPNGMKWKIFVNTFADGKEMGNPEESGYVSKIKIQPRTVIVLTGEPETFQEVPREEPQQEGLQGEGQQAALPKPEVLQGRTAGRISGSGTGK